MSSSVKNEHASPDGTLQLTIFQASLTLTGNMIPQHQITALINKPLTSFYCVTDFTQILDVTFRYMAPARASRRAIDATPTPGGPPGGILLLFFNFLGSAYSVAFNFYSSVFFVGNGPSENGNLAQTLAGHYSGTGMPPEPGISGMPA